MSDDNCLSSDLPIDDLKIKITRRKESEIVRICPKCLQPVKVVGSFYELQNKYQCTKPGCSWVGSVILEVDRENYKKYLTKYKESKE